MKDMILTARGVTKDYWDGDQYAHVLQGTDIDLQRGEFISIMGASGCGKTTLLHILGLMMPPTNVKQFTIDGIDCTTLSDAGRTKVRREKIGFVFQRFNLLRTISARDNVRLAIKLSGQPLNGQVEETMEAVGLTKLAHRKPGKLSIGEQQRVAIARAVACRPAILFADEPTGNLDPDNAAGVLDLFRQFNQSHNLTIVMITHDIACARTADRILKMHDGILEETTAKPEPLKSQ